MSRRRKLLMILTALGLVLLIVLSVFNYLNGVSAVRAQLRSEIEREVRAVASDVELRLREQEEAAIALSRSQHLREYVQSAPAQPSTPADVPSEAQAEVTAFLQSHARTYVAIVCLNADRQPLFRAEVYRGKDESVVRLQTKDFLSGSIQPDDRVWTTADDHHLLRSPLTRETYGAAVRYTIPLFVGEPSANAQRGALVFDLKLGALLDDAASSVDVTPPAQSSQSAMTQRLVIMLDRTGDVIYHTNDALMYQPVTTAMPPSFKAITDAMKKGESGWQFYETTDADRWLTAYQSLATLDLSVAVAGDETAVVRDLRSTGWLTTGLTTLVGLLLLALLMTSLRRASLNIRRVTEEAVNIAGGKLDERIAVQSSDETRLLAESFNAMTERLREQMAREAETKQFESFMRLSAILTHDLKNSILSLSLLVGNMEQQFHNEEFRADAMKSLTEATDKLRALVAKLSEPIRSLSGEFKRPRPVDLVPVIRLALTRTAEPAAAQHEIVIRLPAALIAIADDERIEKVIENLVLNALDAMGEDKGQLTVEAGTAEAGFVFVSVSDTGPGMSEEFQRTKLFHPFATTKKNGVGLGLYTCRELIRALGGRVEVESVRGSGTTFRIVLPSGEIAESVS